MQSAPVQSVENPIGAVHLRRLLFAIINAHQDQMIRKGGVPEAARLAAQVPKADTAMDILSVDEADLGFDSLARLELLSELTERFDLAETGVEDYFLVRRRLGDWLDMLTWHLAERGAAAQFGFASSGSTGHPSWTRHSTPDLLSEIAAIMAGPLLDWQPERIVALVPPQHIYGFLWTVLLPGQWECPVVDLPPGLAAATLRKVRPGDLIVATPFAWEQLARDDRTLPDGVTGITSGAPSQDVTWAAAERLGLSRLIEVYGSTETAGIGWRDAPAEPFILAADIRREGTVLHRASAPGRPLAIQDRLDWRGAREFTVLGRTDHVVQVAGVNVNLAELREGLMAAIGAQDVAIRTEAGRLKAFIVGQRAAIEPALHAHLATLPAPARPTRIDWGTSLPRTPEGKLRDW